MYSTVYKTLAFYTDAEKSGTLRKVCVSVCLLAFIWSVDYWEKGAHAVCVCVWFLLKPFCPDAEQIMACPLNLAPVCGSDGNTYANECTLCVERQWVHTAAPLLTSLPRPRKERVRFSFWNSPPPVCLIWELWCLFLISFFFLYRTTKMDILIVKEESC